MKSTELPGDSILAAQEYISRNDLTDTTNLRELLVFVRRHLHAHPEVGLEEYETSRFLQQILESHDLEIQGPIAGTGFYVEIEGVRNKPVIGYRADIDALPIQDTKDAPYASTVPGVAHLCGHDAHAAIAVGVALLLAKRREKLHGSVRVFFQPNEEGHPSGAPLMIQKGILRGMRSVFACHVDPTLPIGTFGLRGGVITAAADAVMIQLTGPGTGHAARPYETPDIVWVATQIMNTLYQLVGRLTDSRDSAVLTFTRLRAGKAFNVIPSRVEFGGTLRCIGDEVRSELKQYIIDIVTETANLYGVGSDVTYMAGSPAVVNDGEIIRQVAAVIEQRLGVQAIEWVERPSMGSEDFAHYLEHVRGALIRVGTSSGPETSHPLHDSCFDIAEDALPLAAETMANVITHKLRARSNGTT